MANSIMNAGRESTINEFIRNYTIDELTLDTCFFKDVYITDEGRKILVNADGVLDRYIDEIKPTKIRVELTEEDRYAYRLNPKKMSFDIYGTTELWYLILHANELNSISEFDLDVIYIYDQRLVSFISKILDLEKPYIDINEDDTDTKLNS